MIVEELSREESLPKMRVIDDAELTRRLTGREAPFESHEEIPSTPIWGHYETILTKKVLQGKTSITSSNSSVTTWH